jgi:hypothetical protein
VYLLETKGTSKNLSLRVANQSIDRKQPNTERRKVSVKKRTAQMGKMPRSPLLVSK